MTMTLGERLKQVRGALSQAAAAKKIGIPQTTWSNYENDKNKPDTELLLTICEAFEVSRDWLFFGEGPAPFTPEAYAESIARTWNSAVQIQQPAEDDPWKRTPWQEVPVMGLANCGSNDWYSLDKLALRTALPIPYPYRPEMFAVLAMGSSMQPKGIRQGHVAFCDPQAPIDPGDVVYVEKSNGTAALKEFLKSDDTLHLKGWLPPDADGSQDPYYEELEKHEVIRVICVVVVNLKA